MKNAKKIIALVLSVVMVLLTMAVPASAASKIDPSESISAKIEATLYQKLDVLVLWVGRLLNLLIPGLNWGSRWQNYADYESPADFYAGEETFDKEVKENAQWSAGYAYASLLEGIDVFDGTYYMAGSLEVTDGRVPVGIVDDQGVNVFAVSDGNGIVVQAVIDGYGIARGDVLEIRSRLSEFAKENNIISINISLSEI